MDLVYQRATECLAVLQTEITAQRHMDALALLLEGGLDMTEPGHFESAYEAMHIIMADAWFTRAWYLQEPVSGNRKMVLLLRHSEDLFVPDLLASGVYACFELDLFQLHTVLSSICARFEALDNIPLCVQDKYEEMLQKWYDSMAPDHGDHELNVETRTVCSAVQALHYPPGDVTRSYPIALQSLRTCAPTRFGLRWLHWKEKDTHLPSAHLCSPS